MKHPPQLAISACAAALSLTTSLNAATINVPLDNLDGNNATASGYSITSVASGDEMLYTLTNTGDLDGGTVDDTFTVIYRVSAFVGSTSDGTDITLGTAGVVNQTVTSNSNFGETNNDFDDGETLAFSLDSATYTSGEGESSVITFNGFSQFRTVGGIADQDWAVGLTGAEYFDGTARFTYITPTTAAQTLYVTQVTGTSTSSIRDLVSSFTIETAAAPEPSSTALLGLASLGLILRRKRS